MLVHKEEREKAWNWRTCYPQVLIAQALKKQVKVGLSEMYAYLDHIIRLSFPFHSITKTRNLLYQDKSAVDEDRGFDLCIY